MIRSSRCRRSVSTKATIGPAIEAYSVRSTRSGAPGSQLATAVAARWPAGFLLRPDVDDGDGQHVPTDRQRLRDAILGEPGHPGHRHHDRDWPALGLAGDLAEAQGAPGRVVVMVNPDEHRDERRHRQHDHPGALGELRQQEDHGGHGGGGRTEAVDARA